MGTGARWRQVIRANTPHGLVPLNGLNGSSPYVGVVGYAVGGGTDRLDGTILTRRWIDPTNRNSDWAQVPLRPGRFYRIDFDMQPRAASSRPEAAGRPERRSGCATRLVLLVRWGVGRDRGRARR
jgi:X-Pro dipeptidyl-peptidase C-terminal non-catalytic domain